MKPSAKNAPNFSSSRARVLRAQAYAEESDYDAARPSYPAEVVDLLESERRVVDIGCGTGKLTAQLAHAGHMTLALDPSSFMVHTLHRLHPDIPVWQATAEATALKDASVDAASCAQTWHWLNIQEASAEMDRIIAPGGCVLLVWNTIDVTAVPWTLRLTRIMHSGDIQKAGFIPEVPSPWEIEKTLRTSFNQMLAPRQFHDLMHTRSYWLRASEKERAKMTRNLEWYLHEHLGFHDDATVALPYRTDAFLLRREQD